MTKLQQLYDRYGQSPWLDNLSRGDVSGGRLRRLTAQGIRGVTSNPTIIHKAISGSADYDDQLAALAAQGHDAETSYWSLVTDDLNGALDVLRPLHDAAAAAGSCWWSWRRPWPTTPRPAWWPPARCTGAWMRPISWSRSPPPSKAWPPSARGARPQRPLWASTSTKNPAYPDTLYVDSLIGPDTITTLPEATIAAFEDHGILAATIAHDADDAQTTLERLAAVGVDMRQVAHALEVEGVAAFAESYDALLSLLQTRVIQASPA